MKKQNSDELDWKKSKKDMLSEDRDEITDSQESKDFKDSKDSKDFKSSRDSKDDNASGTASKKTPRLWKWFLILLAVAIPVIFFVIIPGLSLFMYQQIFGIRYETPPETAFRVEDFPGLKREHYELPSDHGQILSAYRYFRDPTKAELDTNNTEPDTNNTEPDTNNTEPDTNNTEPDTNNAESDTNEADAVSSHAPEGVVILAHGIGAGHNSYMDVVNYFTTQGFEVFAYDVTGNDESEGKSIKGLPQGIIDLEHVISFVEEQEEFEGLPIFLFGHSWGGYSVTAVLNKHPEVDAVCSVSGFNTSSDLIEAQGEQMIGPAIKVMLPTLYVYERISFGEYSNMTAMEGFEKSDADVMIIHSSDDTTVPIRFGYDIYYEKYQGDPRFHFLKYEDKGHGSILSSKEGAGYSKELRKEYKEYFGDKTPSPEEKQKFYEEHLDREKKASSVDTELLDQVCEFYREAIDQ